MPRAPSDAADAEARATAGVAAATSAPGAGKADKKAAKKTKGAPLVEWKWEEQRERVMHAMAGVLDADLWNLFRRGPSEAFLGLFTKLGCLALESQPALRSKITKGAAFSMLGACALKWGQLENVTTALVHLLNKHEHLPGPIAECAAVAADRRERAPPPRSFARWRPWTPRSTSASSLRTPRASAPWASSSPSRSACPRPP